MKLAVLVLVPALALSLSFPAAGAEQAKGEDEAAYYRVEEIAIPEAAYLEVGGLAFTPDGTLYVCTRRGEVWARKRDGAWSLWASGLHEPTGLMAVKNGELLIAQRPELTRVRDSDGDGKADRFETLTDGFGISGNYHEYHFGPVRDRKGNLYGVLNLAHVGWPGHVMGSDARYRGWAYKVTPRGEFVPFAVGFRSPAGIGISPAGELFIADNQGDWNPTSPLYHVRPGAFHGHPCSLRWKAGYAGPKEPCDQPPDELIGQRAPVAAWFVYGALGHSPGEPVWDTTAGKFGPFRGQMLIGDQTKSFMMRVALEKVGGEYQGAVFPFRRGFGSGIIRMAFDREASLWVGQTDRGWGATGGKRYALQRLSWTGKVPLEILEMKATRTGFDLVFTKPLDREAAAEAARYGLQHYRFKYSRSYGSPHVDVTPVTATAAKVSPDGRRVSLTLPEMVKERVYELHVRDLRAADGSGLVHEAAYYTLNRVP